MVSQQNTISAISAFLAPLQSGAIVTQWLFSLYYGYTIHYILALILTAVQLVYNSVFLIWFYKNFLRKFLPDIGSRITYKKKQIDITSSNQHRHPQFKDPEFRSFSTKHRFSSYLILAMCLVHFEVFKLFYSHFFSFDMFKAKFSNAEKLRYSYSKIQLVSIAVDFLVLVVGITGLVSG